MRYRQKSYIFFPVYLPTVNQNKNSEQAKSFNTTKFLLLGHIISGHKKDGVSKHIIYHLPGVYMSSNDLIKYIIQPNGEQEIKLFMYKKELNVSFHLIDSTKPLKNI